MKSLGIENNTIRKKPREKLSKQTINPLENHPLIRIAIDTDGIYRRFSNSAALRSGHITDWLSGSGGTARLYFDYRAISGKIRLRASGRAAVRWSRC